MVMIVVKLILVAAMLVLLWDLVVLSVAMLILDRTKPVFEAWRQDRDALIPGSPTFADGFAAMKAKHYSEQIDAVLRAHDDVQRKYGLLLKFFP